ncbi:HNH endonuclease [Mastigocoleus sp. MO_188.B34]|uniref:HNH endonuclease n=1 Tax=Mastigocoleus sp. MO_188.B34 TaxID=3036635 RepID=UPI0026259B73|nr:HNH endonuclease [Mastigocoleus sp. MO_188.B34]MDJ0693339.1 HNH endonuclease [Mastigocoleus sp. MO_188.B34]
MLSKNDSNPGQELRKFLKVIFPQDYKNTDYEKPESFILRIDEGLMANGEFTKIVYESSINYLLRRLINTAEYLRIKYQTDEFPPEKFNQELRRFIIENTHIPEESSEKLFALLQACLQAKRKKIKPNKRERLIRDYKSRNELRCYICGKYLNETEAEIEIEHLWPKTMGGATEDFNLKISCSFCNKSKQDYIDASDFHYEQICLVNDKNDTNFSYEMQRTYKVALLSKSNYSCSVCNKQAATVGKLNFGRLNLNDSWHFLNIQAYCDEHRPE